MTDAPASLKDCCVRNNLDDGQIELLTVPTEMYKVFEEVKQCTVVVSSNELKECVEDYSKVYYVQVQT